MERSRFLLWVGCWIGIGLSSFLVPGITAPVVSARETCDQQIAEAEGLLAQGKMKSAAKAFTNLVQKKRCRSIDAYLSLANAHFQLSTDEASEEEEKRRDTEKAYRALLGAGQQAVEQEQGLEHTRYRQRLQSARDQHATSEGRDRDHARFLVCSLRPFAGEAPEESAFDPRGKNSPDLEHPRPIFAPPVRYTDEPRKRRVKGKVVTALRIDEYGCVTHVQIVKGLHRELDAVVLEAHRRYVYKEAQLEGQPIPFFTFLTTTFSIR